MKLVFLNGNTYPLSRTAVFWFQYASDVFEQFYDDDIVGNPSPVIEEDDLLCHPVAWEGEHDPILFCTVIQAFERHQRKNAASLLELKDAEIAEIAYNVLNKVPWQSLLQPTFTIAHFIEEWNFLRHMLPKREMEDSLVWNLSTLFTNLIEKLKKGPRCHPCVEKTQLANLIQTHSRGFQDALSLLPLGANPWLEKNLLKIPNTTPPQYHWLPSPCLVLDASPKQISAIYESTTPTEYETKLFQLYTPAELASFGKRLESRSTMTTHIVCKTQKLNLRILFVLYPHLKSIVTDFPFYGERTISRVYANTFFQPHILYLLRLCSFQSHSSHDALIRKDSLWNLLCLEQDKSIRETTQNMLTLHINPPRVILKYDLSSPQFFVRGWFSRAYSTDCFSFTAVSTRQIYNLLNNRVLIPPPADIDSMLCRENYDFVQFYDVHYIVIREYMSDIYASMTRKAHHLAPGLALLLFDEGDFQIHVNKKRGQILIPKRIKQWFSESLATRASWQDLRKENSYHQALSAILDKSETTCMQDWYQLGCSSIEQKRYSAIDAFDDGGSSSSAPPPQKRQKKSSSSKQTKMK